MEGEWREEQEDHIQAHVWLPPEQVHQSQSKGSGYEAAKVPDKARTPKATKASKTYGQGKGIIEEGYNPRIFQPSHFTLLFFHLSASSSMGFLRSQMQWCPPLMMLTYPVWDPYCQIWVNYPPMMPMTPWGWGVLTFHMQLRKHTELSM
jgi:hypothetical protein